MGFYGKIFGGANIFPYLCPIKLTKQKNKKNDTNKKLAYRCGHL
jgi:hypothetical protein